MGSSRVVYRICQFLVAVYAVVAVAAVVGVYMRRWPGGVDPGSDFAAFYAASVFAAEDRAAHVYDFRSLRQEMAKRSDVTRYLPYHYPPTGLLPIWWLQALPYTTAFLAWLCLCVGAWYAMGRMCGVRGVSWWSFFALPAFFICLTHGQNGWVTALLICGGGALLRHRPLWAGIVLGGLVYKPHFALAFVVALAAGRHWRALLASAASASALVAVSVGAFGVSAWTAFLRNVPAVVAISHREGAVTVPYGRMPTATACMLQLGVPPEYLSLIQLAVTAAVLWGVVRVWKSKGAPFALRMSVLCIATVAGSPFAFDYDMMVVGAGLYYAASYVSTCGEKSGELALLGLLWAYPLLAIVSLVTWVNTGCLVLCSCLAVLIRSGRRAA